MIVITGGPVFAFFSARRHHLGHGQTWEVSRALKRILAAAALVLLWSQAAVAGDRAGLEDELDIFAVEHFDKIQPLSVAKKVEFCGYFGINAAGDLAATLAVPGDADSCAPEDPPPGFDILASYHTHGAYSPDADTEVPSVDDLLGDYEEGIDGYIATPGGRVWLNLYEEELAFQLCGPGCVRPDPDFRECRA